MEDHRLIIDSEKFVVFDAKNASNRNLGVALRVSEAGSKRVSESINSIVPNSLKKKLVFQPYTGFHFTIQWAPEEYQSKINLDSFLTLIKTTLGRFKTIKGTLFFPFLGPSGLYSLLKNQH